MSSYSLDCGESSLKSCKSYFSVVVDVSFYFHIRPNENTKTSTWSCYKPY